MTTKRAFAILLACFAVGCQSTSHNVTQLRPTLVASSKNGEQPAIPTDESVVRQVLHSSEAPLDSDESERSMPEVREAIPNASLDLNTLIDAALSNNPSIAKQKALLEASRGNWLQAGLPPNPAVGYEGQQIGSGGRAEQDGVFVSQEFVRGGKLQLNREVAAQEIAKAEQELVAQEMRVRTDVRIAFFQVLIAQRQAELTKELEKVASESLHAAESLERGKEVGKIDVVQAQLELDNFRILTENAQNRERAAWRTLASVVGDPELPSKTLVGDPDESREKLEWQPTLARLLASSPEIASAMTEIERARWAAERARVEATPNLTVQGLMNVRDNGIGGRPDGAVTIGVPLPIWNRNQGAIVQTAQAAVAAEHALEQLELALQNRLTPVFERYSNARNQVSRYRESILPGAKRALELAKANYEAGESGYVTLLTAQRMFSQTNLNYLESLRELRAAEAEIEGLLLTGSLEHR
jgi:cobalt-zinc-cadmium efflux system outer membrane protein